LVLFLFLGEAGGIWFVGVGLLEGVVLVGYWRLGELGYEVVLLLCAGVVAHVR